MRVLITGGAGFIGSHLADRLAEEGQEAVDAVDAAREALVARGLVR
jgi:nucleoside-diphosphate-sugar epimerase